MDVNQRVEWMRENSKETYEEAKQCMRTNYYGAKIVTEALLPLLQLSPSGRIVNVSSGFGLLRVSPVNTKLLPFAGHCQERFARIYLQTAVACLDASLLFWVYLFIYCATTNSLLEKHSCLCPHSTIFFQWPFSFLFLQWWSLYYHKKFKWCQWTFLLGVACDKNVHFVSVRFPCSCSLLVNENRTFSFRAELQQWRT